MLPLVMFTGEIADSKVVLHKEEEEEESVGNVPPCPSQCCQTSAKCASYSALASQTARRFCILRLAHFLVQFNWFGACSSAFLKTCIDNFW